MARIVPETLTIKGPGDGAGGGEDCELCMWRANATKQFSVTVPSGGSGLRVLLVHEAP